MGAPAASESAIKRAIAAAQACGLAVTSVTVTRDGSVQVVTAKPVDTTAANVSPLPRQWGAR